MGAILVNRNPAVAAAFVNRFGLDYEPEKYLYRFGRIWDTQQIGAAATSAAAVDIFNTSTSSRADHAKGVAGCNLWNRGRIPGGSIMVVSAIEAVWIAGAAPTGALARDVQYYADGAVIEGLHLNGKRITEETILGDALMRAGAEPVAMDNVAAAGAGLVFGARGVTDGDQLSPETLPLITSDDVIKMPVSFSGHVAPSAAATFRFRLLGLLATRR